MIHLHRVDSDKLNHSSPTLTSLGECYLQPASLYSVSESGIQWFGTLALARRQRIITFDFYSLFNAGYLYCRQLYHNIGCSLTNQMGNLQVDLTLHSQTDRLGSLKKC